MARTATAIENAALREVAPRLGFSLLLGLAAALGLPGLAGFWGEWLAVYAAWSPAPDRPLGLLRACAVAAVLGTVLAAGYALRVARLVWSGARTEPRVEDARSVEWGVIAALVAAVVVLGVLPGPLLATTSSAASALVGAAP